MRFSTWVPNLLPACMQFKRQIGCLRATVRTSWEVLGQEVGLHVRFGLE